MLEHVVYYRAPPGDYVVSHIFVNAKSKPEALAAAKKQLKKDARLIRADESPTWEVTTK